MQDNLSIPIDDYLPLRDVVFKTLRQGILTGELKPGERLMEIHLANRLGVSRTPIREAIRKLELEGLVIMIPRRGAEVAEISEKSLKDVLEVRRSLDVLCAELACERITDEGIKELEAACEEFEKATLTKDAKVIASADVALHNIIIEATGNDRLISLIHNLSEQMYRYRFEYIKDESQHGNLVKEHEELLKAIKKRDKKAAAKSAGNHIDNQEISILKQISLNHRNNENRGKKA
ncbi:MAG: GntR family transcriptional regulator [Lachnospiraceae bacterium]|nr:GntR family transcriptional regulator [Lachnospiraceae bacterium]MBR4993616.1 GntR family transcriptional regulator [Lachnospiraceae bacterium]